MRNALTIIATAIIATGCSSPTAPAPENQVGSFPDGTGQDSIAQAAYPSDAEWGTVKNAVVPNWAFVGYASSQDPNLSGVQMVKLADFYNPHGYEYMACKASQASDCATKFPDAVFGENSPWKGQDKPRGLSLGVSAVWCPPCNAEAKNVLPGQYAKFKPLGGHFLIALVDGPQVGVAATFSDVQKWTKKYTVAYSMMTDPDGQLQSMFEPLLPSNAIIRTSDMRIVTTISGAPAEATSQACVQSPKDPNCTYWTTFEKTLASAQ